MTTDERIAEAMRLRQRASRAKWAAANRDKNYARIAKWEAANRDKRTARQVEYRAANRGKEAARVAEYRAKNLDKVAACDAKSRASKLRRTVPWANPEAIDAFYREARRLTLETGTLHEVDHIVPLQGRNVSGFHVEHNLRVIPYFLNRSKSNRHTP